MLIAAADAAREEADVSLDRGLHAVANALQGVVDAERWRMDRSLDPRSPVDDLPPWSAVSTPTPPPG